MSFVMCYLQYVVRELRFNTNRSAYVQTTSRMNRVIERIWHEINQRIVYQLKEQLVNFELNSFSIRR